MAEAAKDLTRKVTICNERGLHARAAAKFVKLAGSFEADIIVVKDGTEVPGGSIMGLMMLAAAPGTEIELRGSGKQAKEALNALISLVLDRFNED